MLNHSYSFSCREISEMLDSLQKGGRTLVRGKYVTIYLICIAIVCEDIIFQLVTRGVVMNLD